MSRQPHISIYIPPRDFDLVDELNLELERIDCNISKMIRLLLPSLLKQVKQASTGKTYRDYTWKVIK